LILLTLCGEYNTRFAREMEKDFGKRI